MTFLKRFPLIVALLLAAIPVSAAPKKAPSAKLDDSLRDSVGRGCKGLQSVIIRTKPGYRQGLRATLKAHGSTVSGEYPKIDAIAAKVSCKDLDTLASFGSTNSISVNAKVKGHLIDPTLPAPPELDLPPSAPAVSAREQEALAAEQLQGNFFATLGVRQPAAVATAQSPASIGVAVIDSGIEPGIDFGNRITAFYDFTHGDIRVATPSDGYGHGTHVAGLVGSTYVGVAPNVRLIGMKVLDGNGAGSTEYVLRAIEFAIASKDVLNIQVLNLSLGHPVFEPAATDPMVQAVESAVRAGLTVVISAGNFGINPQTGQPGYAGVASPGNSPSAISVGAVRTFNTVTRDDDRIAPYSSRGPSWYDAFVKPDLSTAGDNLLSVAAAGSKLRLAQELRGNTGNYMRLSGTSMAAGVVSGIAALMLEVNHGLTPNALKAVLEFSSIRVHDAAGDSLNSLSQGAGAIQAPGAIQLAQVIDPLALPGTSWLTSAVAPTTTIGGQDYAWAQQIIWGRHTAYGADLLSEQRPAWALNIVWGEGLQDDDDNIVWGNNFLDDDNIVWGNSLDDDDNIVWGNNIVWGEADLIGLSLDDDDNIVWGNSLDDDDDNIVWGNNIVWGDDLVGLSLDDDDNIVWGNSFDDDDNIVWGNFFDDNSLDDDDNIVWGNSALLGSVIKKSGNGGKRHAHVRRAQKREVR